MPKMLPVIAAAGLLIALMASAPVAADAQPAGAPVVTDAWARATPGKAVNGAAYLTIESAAADRLTGASTPIAGKAELHEMTMQGNIMRMRQIAGIDVPAGQPVTLKPGGVHIMLLGLRHPLKSGDAFPLTLDFAKAGARQVTVYVAGVGAMGPAGKSTNHTNEGGGGMSMPMQSPQQH
jgi:periplasmic copper chaperone A